MLQNLARLNKTPFSAFGRFGPAEAGARTNNHQLGLYKILFHFEALLLLHNNIFCKHPPFIVQYIAQYYQLLHPPPNFEVFLRCL